MDRYENQRRMGSAPGVCTMHVAHSPAHTRTLLPSALALILQHALGRCIFVRHALLSFTLFYACAKGWRGPKLSLRDLKKRVLEADRLKTIEKSGNHPSLTYVLRVAKENMWIKFWDVALDHGYDGTKASTALLKLLCLTVFRDRHCPMPDCVHIVPENMPLCEHFMECHCDSNNASPSSITDCIISCTSDSDHFMSLIPLGLSLMSVLPF